MLCKKCGKELTPNAFMCVNCGTLTDIGNAVKQPSKEITYGGVTLGAAGLVFSLFFQLVTFIVSAIGLSHALKELDKIRRQESAQSVFHQGETYGQTAVFFAESSQSDKKWQYIKAFQLNLTALILAGVLTIVIILAFLIN